MEHRRSPRQTRGLRLITQEVGGNAVSYEMEAKSGDFMGLKIKPRRETRLNACPYRDVA